MKFDDALTQVFDKETERSQRDGLGEFIISPPTAKICSLAWNIIATAIQSGGLDDFVHIDKKNNIISTPLDPSKTIKKKAVSKDFKKAAAKAEAEGAKEAGAKAKEQENKLKTSAKKSTSKTANKGVLDGETKNS